MQLERTESGSSIEECNIIIFLKNPKIKSKKYLQVVLFQNLLSEENATFSPYLTLWVIKT